MIKLSSIVKTYHMGDVTVNALRGVDVSIDEGEFVAVMGASGSGKSTLMNVIGCLDVPDSGSYVLDGHEVRGLGRNDLADLRNTKIGFVFQNFSLLARTTALENVELPMHYRHGPKIDYHAAAKNALTKVGLGDRLDHMPNQLSGGQQQRVAIARSIVNDPPLILADEPTGALDTQTSIEVMQLFIGLNNSGKTIVLVTHEPDIAGYAKRLIKMRDGEIISDEPVKSRAVGL
ncbi:MAG: ABC transporter ATP-binding protein [Chitinispirillia bacterium]|nr:ABC transporter ATP-binding protein [Chitinispirillia bacterium]MCL2241828.1 ABC transporter ATP-binding protein [Chitinispirillia bacterium]